MTRLSMGMHPSFETLSSHADRTDAPAESRVARHVARCAACREVVAEVRALGETARAEPLESAPAHLWSRIASARHCEIETTRGSRAGRGERADLYPAATSDAERPRLATASSSEAIPKPARSSASRLGIAGVATAAVLLTITLWPARRVLEATGTSRLTFSPSRPVPGGTLRVRYTPNEVLRGAPRLFLVGKYATARQDVETPWHLYDFDVDSLATLERAADGAYEARLTLPADFRSLRLAVIDTAGELHDRDGVRMWTVVGGHRDRTPSLTSLLSAEDAHRPLTSGAFDETPKARQVVAVADSIRRYFPDHPAGWALHRRYGMRKGAFDLLSFFESAERKYASLDERLWARPALDAEYLHQMSAFALRIDEPDETLKWALRFTREHPEDPRALTDLASAIHQVELRTPDGLQDSVRRWMPSLVTAFRAFPDGERSLVRYAAVRTLAQRYGDSTMKAQWPARATDPRLVWFTSRIHHRQSLSADEQEVAHERLARRCERPAGRFSLGAGTSRALDWCRGSQAQVLLALAVTEAQAGRPREAMRLADAALARTPTWFCEQRAAYRLRGTSRLAMADSAAGWRDLAVAAGQRLDGDHRAEELPGRESGLYRAEFDRVADSSHASLRSCLAQRKAASVERRRLLDGHAP